MAHADDSLDRVAGQANDLLIRFHAQHGQFRFDPWAFDVMTVDAKLQATPDHIANLAIQQLGNLPVWPGAEQLLIFRPPRIYQFASLTIPSVVNRRQGLPNLSGLRATGFGSRQWILSVRPSFAIKATLHNPLIFVKCLVYQ